MERHSFNRYKLKFNQQLYNYWKNISIRFLKLMKVDCSGLDKISENEPAVLTPNHVNWKDIFVTAGMVCRPVSFAAIFHLFDKSACYKLLNQYFRKYSQYPVRKNAISQFNNFLAKFLTERVQNLGAIPAKLDLHGSSFIEVISTSFRENKLVCIFPEGGLGQPSRLRRFKLGKELVEKVTKIEEALYQTKNQSR